MIDGSDIAIPQEDADGKYPCDCRNISFGSCFMREIFFIMKNKTYRVVGNFWHQEAGT